MLTIYIILDIMQIYNKNNYHKNIKNAHGVNMYEPIFYCDPKTLTEYEKKLYVVSVGAYLFEKKNTARDCARPEGRSDCHFVCVMRGKSEILADGKMHTLSRGQAVFYGRNTPQYYKHYPTEEGTEIYWIHFDGTELDALLSECGFKDSFVFDFSADIRPIFEDILNELIQKDTMFSKSASASLYRLIVTLSRELLPKTARDEKIEKVMKLMSNLKSGHMTLSEYAAYCSLSVPQFIKRFNKVTGTSPMKYRSQRIINAAVSYLENTSMNINEISDLLGFENAYYFSNMFKKHTGSSPKAYRDKNRKIIAK